MATNLDVDWYRRIGEEMQILSIYRSIPFIATALIACLCIGCTTPETSSPTPPTGNVKPEAAIPSGPAPLTAEAKQQSSKLTQQNVIELLQNGDETGARSSLEQALRLDPGNELAHKLMDQIKSDAHKDLGSISFAYTVQPDDTLGKLAQRFLNDRYRFYSLAKYNDMRVPNKLAVGQVIRIPGNEPKISTPKVKPVDPVVKRTEPPVKSIESLKAL
jgi:LysM repeat protein